MNKIQWVKGNNKINNRKIKTGMGSWEVRGADGDAGEESGEWLWSMYIWCIFKFSNNKTWKKKQTDVQLYYTYSGKYWLRMTRSLSICFCISKTVCHVERQSVPPKKHLLRFETKAQTSHPPSERAFCRMHLWLSSSLVTIVYPDRLYRATTWDPGRKPVKSITLAVTESTV